ncbi:MAG: limonene-1,2-epoxide hydrolase [Acidimicrobiales bacterium]|jgi:limonene-1,2-epoxide hydrolase
MRRLTVAAMTPSETVTAFIQAIERLDLDGAVAMLSDDVSYENVPMNPIAGREGVRAALAGFLGSASEVSWPVSSQFEHGNRVANERVDRFKIGEGWLEMPVAGFFDVNDQGLITLWRDYFDLATYTDQMAALRS